MTIFERALSARQILNSILKQIGITILQYLHETLNSVKKTPLLKMMG